LTKAKYGYAHVKRVHKKLGKHSKKPNPKHKKVKRKYRGQGR